MSEPNETPDITPEMKKRLTDMVNAQCTQITMFALAGKVRDKAVATFMQKWINEYLGFNSLERALILKFMVETEEAVTGVMKEVQKNKDEFGFNDY